MNSFRGIFQGFYLDFKNAVLSPSPPPPPPPPCSPMYRIKPTHFGKSPMFLNLNVNVHLHQHISRLWLFAGCLLLFAGDLWLFPGSFGYLLVVCELLWWSVVIACFSNYRLFLRLHQLTESGSRSRVCDENWKVIKW